MMAEKVANINKALEIGCSSMKAVHDYLSQTV